MKAEPVVVERVYNSPVNRVWSALTELKKMQQWYFPMLTEFEPEVGFETRFDVKHSGKVFPHIWKVTEVIPNKKISYEWRFDNYPGNSVVSFELFDMGDQTKIVCTHTGLETFKGDVNPDLARHNFVEGWTHFIGTALKNYVEQQNVE
jgi:uncharacterized protein YndB with AHSA1/START domain